MFLEYQPEKSFLHRLDVRTKGLGFMVLTAAAIMFTNPVYNLGTLLICLWLALASKMPLQHVNRILKPLYPVLLLIILVTAVSFPLDKFQHEASRAVLFTIFSGHLKVTLGGLLFGLSLALRILIMVLASSLLTYSTPVDHFLQVLRMFRLPYQIGFIATTGIRFVPTMEKKARQIMDAQRSRGARFSEGGAFRRIKAYVPVMVPLVVHSLRMSENMAMAMMNRGFGAADTWTLLEELTPGRTDVVVSILAAGILAATVYFRAIGYGIL